jgi:hypothetical protein
MPLLAGDLLARIVAGRTDPNPPFSALFKALRIGFVAWLRSLPGLALLFVVGTLTATAWGQRTRWNNLSSVLTPEDSAKPHTQSGELTSPIVPGGDFVAEADPSTVRQLRALHSSETPSLQSTCGAE